MKVPVHIYILFSTAAYEEGYPRQIRLRQGCPGGAFSLCPVRIGYPDRDPDRASPAGGCSCPCKHSICHDMALQAWHMDIQMRLSGLP